MQISPIDTVCHGPRSTTTPHRLEYFLSNKIQWQSRGRGKKKLNMKGKMIWRRRRGKVKIWWRRFAVNETAEGQSSERINQCRVVIGGGNSGEKPRDTRGGFTPSQSTLTWYVFNYFFLSQNQFFILQKWDQVSQGARQQQWLDS